MLGVGGFFFSCFGSRWGVVGRFRCAGTGTVPSCQIQRDVGQTSTTEYDNAGKRKERRTHLSMFPSQKGKMHSLLLLLFFTLRVPLWGLLLLL